MNKCNLNKNDIIIILVIFIVFCIFMYVNNYNTYENFQIAIKHKSNDDIIIGDFLDNLKNYLGYFKELNNAFYELIIFFETHEYDQTIFDNSDLIDKLNKIKGILNEMKNSGVSQTDAYIFQDFFKIQSNHIFNEYTELFNSLNVMATTGAIGTPKTTGDNQLEVCGKYYEVLTNDFFNNLKSIDSERYNLDKLDDKITSIDLYFKNLKSIDKYNNIMDIFKDYRYVLISLLNNFEETTNIIVTLMTDCNSKTSLTNSHNTIVRQFRTSNKIIDDLIDVINLSDPADPADSADSAKSLNNLLDFETKFCDKFKKLNKPDKSNIIFKKFTNDIIQKKLKYVKKLETNIKLIQDEMTEKELNDYNLNRLRTNDQASKQYTAIKQAINNIKNRDKIKINLT